VPDGRPTEDVIDLLHRQHEEIRRLFTDLERARADDREQLIHRLAGGSDVVDARVAEERRATELLGTLVDIGPAAEGFDTLLTQLRDDVLAHADHEESAEFPLLRQAHDRDRLVSLAGAVRAAERIAPTRPHPGVESPAANFLLGPPLAIMDRVRDAIRNAAR
jgi:hypothetical protein